MLAFALATAVAAGPLVGAGRWWPIHVALGGIALALLALALLFRWPAGLPWPLAFLGAEYAVSIMLAGEGFDGRAPLYGGGLLAVAELSYWATDRGWAVSGDTARRLVGIALLSVGAVGASSAVLAVAAVNLTGGVVLEALGVAAAVAALAVVAVLARQRAGDIDQAG